MALLARWTPTLLLNGIYELQIVATDSRGRTGTSETHTLVVERNLKVGHFTLSFSDLTVPLAGVPIEIVRTYDSRDRRTNDFGVGWSLDIRNVRLQKTRNLGANWNVTFASPWYSLDAIKPRRVTVTLAGDKAYTFESVLNPSKQFGFPIESTHMTFTNVPGTYGKLEIDGDNQADLDGFSGFVNLIDIATFEYFNPTRFKFTTAEGDVYIIDEKEGLKSLSDRNGNTLTITTNGIFHSSGINVAFARDAQGRITSVTDPAGRKLLYAYGSNGGLSSFTDRETNMTTFAYTNIAFPNYLTQITDPRGFNAIRTEFDSNGRMIRQIDAAGNVVEFTHDLADNREIVRDRLGNVTIHEYDDHGNVLRTTDALGHVTRSLYDALDNELERIDALGNTNRFTYDASGNKITETDPLGYTTRYTYGKFREVTSITNPRGFVTTNIYDDTGLLLEQRDPTGNSTHNSYDGSGNVLTHTDVLGNIISNRYDSLGYLTNSVVIDRLRGILSSTSFSFDANGNQTATALKRTTTSGVEILTTAYRYDAENRLIATIHPDGSSNTLLYAVGLKKPVVEIDPLGRQTLRFYDERGNLTNTVYADATSESMVFDAENRKVMAVDRAGRSTFYTNDALGRLVSTRLPGGDHTNTFYDAIGRIVATQDERGNTTRFAYDPNCGCSGRQAFITNAVGEVTQRSYDENGNEASMTDALGRTSTYVYDALDRRTHVLLPDGTFTVTTYDASGRRSAHTDQSTNTTWFAYDALGRLVAVTNALGNVTSYAYDEAGSLVAQTDANNHTTTYAYDAMKRRVNRRLPLGQVERYEYDLAGNLTNRIDFNGRSTRYTYDASNRLLSKIPDAFFAAPSVAFIYTATGRRASMSDAGGVTVYAYNSRDWLTNKTWTPVGQASGLSLNYVYDPHGNVTRITSTTANGTHVDYQYDELNRLARVDDAHTGATTYSYDAVGNLQDYTYPNGLASGYSYDSLNRLTNITTFSQGVNSVANYRYTVTPTGRRRTTAETVLTGGGPQTINRVYTYDAAYRLTGESLGASSSLPLPPSANITYTLDNVGNRLARSSTLPVIASTSVGYDANDRLLTDAYDANGNTVSGQLRVGAPTVSDAYDFEDRLINRNNGQVVVEYDGDGNRVRKTVGGVTTLYLVDDRNPTGYAQALEELTVVGGTPVVTRVYAYGNDLISQDQLINQGQPGVTWQASFYGYDGGGNVRYLTSGGGAVTDTYDYDAFGNLIAQIGTTPNNCLYRGEQFDADLGLYYNRARYLNVDSGRFWTQDKFEGAPEDPTSLHKYLYAHCDPVNNSDPTGMVTFNELMQRIGLDKWLDSQTVRKLHQVRRTFATYCANVARNVKTMTDMYDEMRKTFAGTAFASHHIIQDAKMLAFTLYERGIGLAMPVLGKYGQKFTPHWIMNQVQSKMSWSPDLAGVAWYALRASGCRAGDATEIVDFAKGFFELMGIIL
jgi:RHS repeat-associated protein